MTITQIKFDWKFFFTLFAAVAGLIVPILIWQADLSAKSLKIQLDSSVPLQFPGTLPITDLQIFIDGNQIKDPVFSTLEITNNGSKPIVTSDFESDIYLKLKNSSKIIRAKVTKVDPADLEITLKSDENSASIKPLLLNPNDKFTISILTSGEIPEFSPQSRIAGISSIKFNNQLPENRNWKNIIINGVFGFMGVVIYFIIGGIISSPSGKRVSKTLLWITAITVGALAMLAVRNVFVLAEIPRDTISISATFLFLIGIGAIANIIFKRRQRYS